MQPTRSVTASRRSPPGSGPANPAIGRPKGAKNKIPRLNEERLKEIILAEAYRDITVRDGARAVTIPLAQAIVQSLAVNGAKGQHRSQRLFAEMLAATERQNKKLSDEWHSTAMDYKIEWDRELQRREQLGITDLPPPLPHPDHVKIDMNTGQAWIAGPMTKEEAVELEMWRQKRAGWQEDLKAYQADLENEQDEGIREFIRSEIAHVERVLAIIDRALSVVD